MGGGEFKTEIDFFLIIQALWGLYWNDVSWVKSFEPLSSLNFGNNWSLNAFTSSVNDVISEQPLIPICLYGVCTHVTSTR